ncbi:hypothetical protein PA25_34490 [Pseudoalteromonas sp. A25]|uniref:efflux RND transporter periplasmic adaptor subunit n=1 Tax=Pseudoalteromonas sp. A25 TaxID=116092 RepID=UPI001260566B|nr:efflux RND transporter periplasmic adaptor subunit [Pseudoalteromonas sp. A25]BBN83464.1 hypothetical protein PA25_34490 [Pseudoalteromonas sp. A25]
MFKFNTMAVRTIAVALLFTPYTIATAGENHDHHNEQPQITDSDNHAQNTLVSLTQRQIKTANIQVSELQPRFLMQHHYAPGVLKENGYTSYIVSPRTDSVIMTRHVALGQKVNQGDKLITLYSESMADAQADYMVSQSEWLRIQNMQKQTLSESERVVAKTRYLASVGRLNALGLSHEAISALTTQSDIKLGQYTLYAQVSGVVLQDDFTQGQRVNTGQTLLRLADEQNLWVEARLSANDNESIDIKSTAKVQFKEDTYHAKVIQESHTIDPITRTRTVRLVVNNADDRLHAGMFVNVYFNLPSKQPLLAVPETALMQNADEEWQVFVLNDHNQFLPQRVTRGRPFGDLVEISGLPAGTQVVTQGAFFISSEFAKSNFDIHNH